MAGSACFLDKANRLQGEVAFGRIPGRDGERLLQRPDSIQTSIYEVSFPDAPRASSPQASSELVRSFAEQSTSSCTHDLNAKAQFFFSQRLLCFTHMQVHVSRPAHSNKSKRHESQCLRASLNQDYKCIAAAHFRRVRAAADDQEDELVWIYVHPVSRGERQCCSSSDAN